MVKVILKEDIPKVGEQDNVVKVADGFARNYLIPRGLATMASKKAIAAADKRRAEKEQQMEAKRAELEALAKKLTETEIIIAADAGEGERLFGSITSQDIALAVKEQAGEEIDKRKIELVDHLKVLGEYTITIKLFKDIVAKVKVKITAK